MTVSTTCVIDEAPSNPGATDSYEYDAFGNSFTVSGSTPNNYLYRGEQFDSDLGLYYLRARYYNPATGRFMSKDPLDYKPRNPDGTPIDPKVLHKYLYAGGDPVNLDDPRGEESLITRIISAVLAVALANPNAEEYVAPHIDIAIENVLEAAEQVLEEAAQGSPPPPL